MLQTGEEEGFPAMQSVFQGGGGVGSYGVKRGGNSLYGYNLHHVSTVHRLLVSHMHVLSTLGLSGGHAASYDKIWGGVGAVLGRGWG